VVKIHKDFPAYLNAHKKSRQTDNKIRKKILRKKKVVERLRKRWCMDL